MTQPSALITGITGQDGAYLARFLLRKGYRVFGTYRRASSLNFWRIEALGIRDHPDLELVEHDLTDLSASITLLQSTQVREVYNLAAQSSVRASFDQPITTADITALGALNLLEATRLVSPDTRFYQASSSEMFGATDSPPDNEDTPFHPSSPYAVSKLFAHWSTVNYRESHGLFAVSGILCNHESPLRGQEFVTRKIADGLAAIRLGEQDVLELGNLDAQRDWGYADDYVDGMYRMLQTQTPEDYVLATGRTQSVRDFVGLASAALGMEIDWRSSGMDEIGVERSSGKTIVRVNEKFYRPADVDLVVGDASKAKAKLGWSARTTLEELAKLMVNAAMRRREQGQSF